MPTLRSPDVLWLAASAGLAFVPALGADGPCGAVSAAPGSKAEEVETRLFLVGDAGNPAPRGEPVLTALARELARDPAHSLVAFLGDNVYPRGLPAADARSRSEAERRLGAQVAAVRASGARGLFLPGNHDWASEGEEGWEAVRRQAAFVDGRGAPTVVFRPEGGCPGPAVVDLGARLRLVLLDTQWWLHEGPRPRHPASDCPADSEEEVLEALREALCSAGDRQVVVLAHHPLASGGAHGGQFGWKAHVFPLQALRPWLWIPLPGVGSLYPLARQEGISVQDLSSEKNRQMRAALEGVLRQCPPLVYGAGHEHNLQVLRGGNARHLLVSGAGIFGRADRAVCLGASRFALARAGFMKLDVERGGRVRLAVLEVDARGAAGERFSTWLE